MPITPRYLFRCSSDQSNDTNTPNLFAPASLSDHDIFPSIPGHKADFMSLNGSPNPRSNNTFGDALRQALLWKKDQTQCPFLFFTTSPIFAVQLAAWRNAKKVQKDSSVVEPDAGVRITILDTATARTSSGGPVEFHSVPDLLREHGIELRNRGDGEVREYADHWVCTTDVVSGRGSCYAELGDLVKNGLWELYPQIKAANERRDPRPCLTTKDLRKFFFDAAGKGRESLLVRETLDTAARVAMGFRTCKAGEEGDDVDVGLPLAYVLGLRKRDLEDLGVRFWVRDHTEKIEDCEAAAVGDGATLQANDSFLGIPDAEEFDKLQRHFTGFRFLVDGLAFGLSIDLASIEKEKADWSRWWKANREEWRANHPRSQERQNWREKRHNRPRELLERRARHDSVIGNTNATQRAAPRELFPSTTQRAGPRELFPQWQSRTSARQESRHQHSAQGGGRAMSYHVLESRPGDLMTTQASQQHRPQARPFRRRDHDSGPARRRKWRRGEMVY